MNSEMPLNKTTAHLCPITYNSYIPLSQIKDIEIYDSYKTEEWIQNGMQNCQNVSNFSGKMCTC